MLDFDPAQLRKRRKFWTSKKGDMRLEDDGDAILAGDIHPLNLEYMRQQAGDFANFVGDQLAFTGFDLASARQRESVMIGDDASSIVDYEDHWETERRRYSAHLKAMKDNDKALVRSANEKMRRAREKGRNRASLTQEEVEALERRRLQERQDSKRRSDRKSSGSKNGRSSSGTKDALDVQKTRRKSGDRSVSTPAGGSSRTRGDARSPKLSRHASLEDSRNYTPAGAYPLSPILANDSPRFPSDFHPQVTHSPYVDRSFSDTSHRYESAGYDGPYMAYSPSAFSQQTYRTSSQPHTSRNSPPIRRPADELHMPHGRARASSSVQFADAHARPSPSGYSRRNVSGPAEMSSSKLRMMDLASPMEEHSSPLDDAEDEGMGARPGASASMESVVIVKQESEDSPEDDDDDEDGAEVRVELKERDGYRIARVPVGREKEKEKGRRRRKR